jgi:hypothetical protein
VSGVTRESVQWYVDTALVKMLGRAEDLGDELLSTRPDVEGANSVYALVVHCCGVMERWGGEAIAGRTISRDRASEFTATGTLAQLEELVAAQRRRWVDDLVGFEPGAAPRGPAPRDDGDPEVITQEFVALHVVEELFQHLGHVDLTVDLLRS